MKKGGKKSNVKVQQQNNPASREKSAKREREGPPLREAGTLRQNKLESTAFPNGITGQRSVFVLRQVYISHLVFSLWFVRWEFSFSWILSFWCLFLRAFFLSVEYLLVQRFMSLHALIGEKEPSSREELQPSRHTPNKKYSKNFSLLSLSFLLLPLTQKPVFSYELIASVLGMQIYTNSVSCMHCSLAEFPEQSNSLPCIVPRFVGYPLSNRWIKAKTERTDSYRLNEAHRRDKLPLCYF